MSLRDRFIHASINPRVFAGVLSCAILSCSAIAQTSPGGGKRPAAAGRIVRAFDFEEQDYNPLPVPIGWVRAQEDPAVPRIRPGFPIWNGGVLDYKTPAYSGMGTAKLPTAGGSTSLLLRKGEINIFPNADYIVSARVRTDGLKYAKARVVARLLDRQGTEILEARAHTPLVNTQGEWTQVSVELEGVYPGVAFVQLELELLQPEQQQDDHDKIAFEVWDQDFEGAAWFDNLIIAQLPRLGLSSGEPGNIIESMSRPELQVLVRDLTGDAIIASAHIYDVHGALIDQEVLADGDRRIRTNWTPNLPGFGWYRAILEVSTDNQLVGRKILDFIWASPNDEHPDSGMFGIHAKLTDNRVARSAAALVKGAGVSSASVELWTRDTTKESLKAQRPQMQALDELVDLDITLSAVLSQLPQELATELAKDPQEVMTIFAGPAKPWVGWGGAMLDKYGQVISNWRLGNRASQEDAAVLDDQLDRVAAGLAGYIPGPVVVTPWSLDRPLEQSVIGPSRQLIYVNTQQSSTQTMELIVNSWVPMADVISPSTNTQPSTLGIVLEPTHQPGTISGVEVWTSVGALARKAISFWWYASKSNLGNNRFDLELANAWWVSPGKRGQVMPAPELVVWRTLATHLGTRNAIEKLDIIPGVNMLVAGAKPDEDQSKGIMILWLDKPSLEPLILNLPLSTNDVVKHDIFNNQTTIPLSPIGALGLPVHQIQIGRSPIIITGVNTQLVEFLSHIKLDPDKLQANSGIHKHAITLANPWPFSIRGRVFIVEPGGYTDEEGRIDRSWEISPRVIPFSLSPNEQQAIPIDIAYSLGEIAGIKKLTFDVELQADKDYPLMRVEKTIELGLDHIDMQLTARREQDGITIVGVHVTNKLDTDQDFEVIAIPPQGTRLRRSINAIKPGEKVTREFAFTNTQSGDEIVVALMLHESSVRLNQAVIVP